MAIDVFCINVPPQPAALYSRKQYVGGAGAGKGAGAGNGAGAGSGDGAGLGDGAGAGTGAGGQGPASTPSAY